MGSPPSPRPIGTAAAGTAELPQGLPERLCWLARVTPPGVGLVPPSKRAAPATPVRPFFGPDLVLTFCAGRPVLLSKQLRNAAKQLLFRPLKGILFVATSADYGRAKACPLTPRGPYRTGTALLGTDLVLTGQRRAVSPMAWANHHMGSLHANFQQTFRKIHEDCPISTNGWASAILPVSLSPSHAPRTFLRSPRTRRRSLLAPV
jgi:hypothetical protein